MGGAPQGAPPTGTANFCGYAMAFFTSPVFFLARKLLELALFPCTLPRCLFFFIGKSRTGLIVISHRDGLPLCGVSLGYSSAGLQQFLECHFPAQE